MSPQPAKQHGRREPRATAIDARKDGPNIRLAKEMGSKRGYDPIPPSQYEWQAAEGEPPLYRMWSWFCSHTIAFGRMSPFAVRADGTPATLKDCARDLGLDLGHISNLFKWGAQKGLWSRRGGRELFLSGDVKAEDVRKANNERIDFVHSTLTPIELSIIQTWAPKQREHFLTVWQAAQEHHRADLALTVAERRAKHAEIDNSIRAAFPLPKKRTPVRESRQPVVLPEVIVNLIRYVHSTSVHSPAAECTGGEEMGENVTVPEGVSLCVSEKIQKGAIPAAASVLDLETEHLVEVLQIDAAAAFKLLTDCRKVEPTITWREVLALCEHKLTREKPRNSLAALLMATVPAMAKGALLALAREKAQERLNAEMRTAAIKERQEREQAEMLRQFNEQDA